MRRSLGALALVWLLGAGLGVPRVAAGKPAGASRATGRKPAQRTGRRPAVKPAPLPTRGRTAGPAGRLPAKGRATAVALGPATPAAKPGAPKPGLPGVAAKPGELAGREDEAPSPEGHDPDRERILRLQEALASVVHGPVLGRLRVGMNVVEADTGRTIFRRRGTVLMDPASNQKLLATTTALMRLGASFRFRTELAGAFPDAGGIVHGDLVLRGSGDPSLRTGDLEALAALVASQGTTRLEGGVLADPRRLGSTEEVEGERSPLRLGGAAVIVRVHPGAKVGDRPLVSVRPMPEAFKIENRASTRARGRSRVSVSVSSWNGQLVVNVGGGIALTHPGLVVRRTPPNPRLYAATVLRAALIEAGVEVSGPAGVVKSAPVTRTPPTPVPVLAVHESEPLSTLIRRINKDSDNEWADRLIEVVGAELYGGAATPAKGLRALREAMEELGLPAHSYVCTNGSGLGHGNRVTANAIAELLHKLYSDPRWGPELVQSLSVGGVDGTTRNRFRGSPAAERVRAKTGTLMGKSCLSGYVGDGHEILIFSIMVEGLRGRALGLAAVRNAQVVAVNAMMRYARGALGAPEEEQQPGMDLETGEEEQDGEEDDAAHVTPPAAPAPPPAATPAPVPGPAAQRQL